MDIEFEDDELIGALAAIVNRMADEAELSDKDRAMLKRWRASKLKLGTDDFNEFVTKANEDFARTMQRRERSQIRRPDWVGL
ncbi:MAG TPA: hypothetical protein QGF35_00815 [Dehalococcoidia bacterium]|jgi:hypothetical protein|nr:hypothetical protein [Dehalococcoidia bacterium]